MHLFEILEQGLYWLSTLFFYPVVLALFLLLAKTFYDLGLFAKEAFLQLRQNSGQNQVYLSEIAFVKERESDPVVAEIELGKVLQSAARAYSQKIRGVRFSVKMGPTLGLIGTLTPMAKALSGLSSGDLSSLSGQMITAFSTTVLGLIISGIAFSIAHVRTKWEKREMDQLTLEAEYSLQTVKNNKI